MLWRCLHSCKDFIHTFLSYQNQDLFYLTAFIYPRLSYAFITLLKLVFLEYYSSSTRRLDQSDTRDCRRRLWKTSNIAEEAEFQELSKQILEKFSAVATDFVGADGERDAMSNLASAMRMLMVEYDQQMNEIQGALRSAETSTSAVGMTQEYTGAVVDPIAHSSVQGVDYGGNGSFDIAVAWESLANTGWEDLLQNFI